MGKLPLRSDVIDQIKSDTRSIAVPATGATTTAADCELREVRLQTGCVRQDRAQAQPQLAAEPQNTVEPRNSQARHSSSPGSIHKDDEDMQDEGPSAPRIPAMRFIPLNGEAYQMADICSVVEDSLGASRHFCVLWRQQIAKRALEFRDSFVRASREFDLGRSEKRRVAMEYMTGQEQRRQCECCRSGAGPFPRCIVSALSFSGACANCASSSGADKRCNFHPESMLAQASRIAPLTCLSFEDTLLCGTGGTAISTAFVSAESFAEYRRS